MSASRRQSSGEDNILARLERDGKRGAAGKSWKHINTTIAWCGLASLAVVGLIAVLASLAKENAAVHGKPIVVEAKAPADRYANLDGKDGFALPAVGSPPRRAALIVDEPLPRPMLRSTEASHVPPMVMLKPAAGVAAKPPAAVPARPAATGPVKLAAAVPAKPASARVPPARPAAKSPPPKPARVKVAAAPARPKKAVPAPAAAKPAAAGIDSDVALLSAIIMHASRHAAERAPLEAPTCPPGKKCPAPKATD